MEQDIPLDTVSPLSNLLRITRQIANYQFSDEFKAIYGSQSGHYNLGPSVSFFLGRPLYDEPYTLPQMLEDYSYMHELCIKSLSYVTRNSPLKAQTTNLGIIQSIVQLYSGANISTLASHMHNFSPETLMRAEMVDQNISDKEAHYYVPENEISSLSIKIDGLITEILASSFTFEIRERLVSTLMAMSDGIRRINFIGPDKMLQNIDIFLGQSLQNVGTHINEPEKQILAMRLLKSGVEIAESAQKIVESALIVAPVFILGYDKLQQLLPTLP